ncbi:MULTISPECIES: hypothetical protein [unclassified Moorena]|uniref:hypothetical protein n=1 Tax=unclassified Moorena TaxID=2683338 RepID=UPI0025E2EF78|nr:MULTISPECIES: hypothetical protein [unclassified Moorena]
MNRIQGLAPSGFSVTENTVALFFNIQPEEIYRIDCWQHVVYVHAKGVSQFVSYADFPPILGVDPPKTGDYDRWLKRRKGTNPSNPWVFGADSTPSSLSKLPQSLIFISGENWLV